MQNNINKNERDAFSDLIRQKLENHRLTVDSSIWEGIKARLTSNKRKIMPFWWWLSGGAAVAVLALLFTLQPLSESKEVITKSTKGTLIHVPAQPKQVVKPQFNEPIQPQKEPIIASQSKIQLSVQGSSSIASNFTPAQRVVNDSVERIKTTENRIGNSQKAPVNTELASSQSNDSVKGNQREIPNSLVAKNSDEPVVTKKHKSSWLLAATVGSNGSLPTGNGNGEFLAGDKTIVSATPDYTSIMTPNEFRTINYLPPLSFGVTVRKNLNKEWSLESGLVYTYLLTTFENTGVQRNDARLHLHYIGVPLNLVAQLWNLPKWEIYLSGGAMLEKGIKSVYVQNQYIGNQTITTTALTDINGFQWSVNGAAGTTYKIQRNIGIFFEPKISYYFDNNQPLSARTENPIVIGLSAGVRFRFK